MPQKKIMIIEDDLVLLETIQEILTLDAYECLGISDTEHVFSHMEQFKPDLFLIDYMLPDWNGGELSGAIRGMDLFEQTPIIIMSAYARVLFPMTEYGCNAVLEKPFHIDELSKLVKSYLRTPIIDSGLFPKIRTIMKKR
ncbi:response regulator [Pedobacter frigidisoli]|uniref:Response regulator n=1 Tax=Pedobacter frigidisoli TaxID=2530455 RepID=A0A4R0NZH9_9SPHI|nr:response regulator [Pedobacter frigidisoli]TCD07585.1 response regulator [Pedobacter frigidisoli]